MAKNIVLRKPNLKTIFKMNKTKEVSGFQLKCKYANLNSKCACFATVTFVKSLVEER